MIKRVLKTGIPVDYALMDTSPIIRSVVEIGNDVFGMVKKIKLKVADWIVNTKLDNFIKVFKFVINRTYISKCSMNSYVIKPVDIVM
ncbi:hypothetical protein J6TS2_51830 [Heyndrickxia sporothermodurans]|nr:hypothetical protein J6TS2_51830 [Heyndrickxia sporothermodurans]